MASALEKILVLRFSSLGDIIMTTPTLRALRKAYPKAIIDMVVRSDFLDLIKFNPHLNRKIALPRDSGLPGLRDLRDQINKENYDLIYDAHRSLRTRVLMPQLNARHKAYFDKQYVTRNLSLTFKLKWLENSPRFLEKFVAPLRPFGVEYDGGGPEMFLDSTTYQSAQKKIPLPASAKVRVGFIPSAQWPGKRWPAERFREVLERLLAETTFEIVVFGGKEDTFCDDICKDLPTDRVVNAQGKLSIAECAAVLDQCAFVISNDTGLMHIADALGVPSVLIFGPTSGELGCLPFHPDSEILEHDLWCRPCSKNGEAPCIRSKRLCLDNTSSADVFQATMRLAEKVTAADTGPSLC